jgi:zinc D-Ala-D-Ala dipeptidase
MKRSEFLKIFTGTVGAVAAGELLPAYSAIQGLRKDSKVDDKIAKMECPIPESETPPEFVSLADAGYPQDLIHLVYKDNGGDNKFGCPLYTPDQRAFVLDKEMAQNLIDANNYMREKYGLQIFVVDAFRTTQAQATAYNIAQSRGIPSRYVSKPGKGKHPKGRAVDVILVDMSGNNVKMGADYDTFNKTAHYNSNNKFQKYLREVMGKFRFNSIEDEYWHFSWDN